MTARLDAIASELRSATHPAQLPSEVETIYPALGDVVDLLRTLEAATRHLSESVAHLPGIVGGLRIDNIGEPVAPETVRDSAAASLAAAASQLKTRPSARGAGQSRAVTSGHLFKRTPKCPARTRYRNLD